MQITGMRTKYYLLSVVAFVVAFVVLALLPTPAQAQGAPGIIIDKECTPNPVQVGEQITCTIDLEAAPRRIFIVDFTDTFEAGVTPTEATLQILVPLGPPFLFPCTVSGNTVTCRPFTIQNFPGAMQTATITIEAIAEQCGTFTNTATAEEFGTDTEDITVVGCAGPGAPGAPAPGAPAPGAPAPEPGQQPNQQPNQQGVPAPITQEGEQESESGEIDQSFEVS